MDIMKLCFLVPVKVSWQNGQESIVNVDLVNRKVYNGSVPWNAEDTLSFFKHLDQATHMPEDYYADRGQDVKDIIDRFEKIQDNEWEIK
jgi:hypothetical protein